MAFFTVQFLLILISLITLSNSQYPFSPNSIILPITKDLSSLQYVTQLQIGETLSSINLGINLSGPFVWLDCSSSSSQKNPIKSYSIQCSMAKSSSSCDQKKTCGVQLRNPFSRMVSRGELNEVKVGLEVTDGLKIGSLATIDHGFLFSCVEDKSFFKGLGEYGIKGMIGLGNTRISLPSQVSSTFGFSRKFALCLSSSNGIIISGENDLFLSRSLLYTPFTFQGDNFLKGYYIKVNSMKINSKKLVISKSLLNQESFGVGGTKISTTLPYTTMDSTIYSIFVEAYIKAAMAMNITRVSPIAPFEVCFSSKGVENTRVGVKVPIIDLVLQSEMVKWKIEGRNSMVHVSEEVMCLGFLDGGLNMSLTKGSSIVIGGYQLEDRFLEFNLGNSMLGFSSSSLLMGQRSCSELRSNSIYTL